MVDNPKVNVQAKLNIKLENPTFFQSISDVFEKISEQIEDGTYDAVEELSEEIADFDVFIAKQGVRTARSEYFPKINASVGTEYTKNFKDFSNSTVSGTSKSQ